MQVSAWEVKIVDWYVTNIDDHEEIPCKHTDAVGISAHMDININILQIVLY